MQYYKALSTSLVNNNLHIINKKLISKMGKNSEYKGKYPFFIGNLFFMIGTMFKNQLKFLAIINLVIAFNLEF